MTLGDIYKNKITNNIIQIESFASHMGNFGAEFVIVFSQIFKNDVIYGSYPSNNGYGTKEEIEKDYELLVPIDELKNYNDWEDIFNLINK